MAVYSAKEEWNSVSITEDSIVQNKTRNPVYLNSVEPTEPFDHLEMVEGESVAVSSGTTLWFKKADNSGFGVIAVIGIS